MIKCSKCKKEFPREQIMRVMFREHTRCLYGEKSGYSLDLCLGCIKEMGLEPQESSEEYLNTKEYIQ